jgi:transposase
VSIKELARRHGIDRNTVRRALRSDAPPVYRRASVSKLDPFNDEIHRLLKADPKMPGQRIRELIAPLGLMAARRSSMPTWWFASDLTP